jgi:hypothetical protein
MQIKSVAIFGDSWGVSSWKNVSDNDGFKEHVGDIRFQELFEENKIKALNFSKSAISNQIMLKQLHNHTMSESEICDFYLIVKTDPLRDCFIYDSDDIQDPDSKIDINQIELPGACDLDQVSRLLSQKFYNGLSEIQKKINRPILLVGGLSKLDHQSIPDNLYFIYPSWTELLSKNFTDCYYESTFRTMSIYDALRKKLDWDYQSKAKWFEIEKAIKVKNKIWEESDYFSRRHPSDIGFVPMFDVIMKKIGEIK